MKKILITGGLGFIGTSLVARLLEQGSFDIRILDMMPPTAAPQAFDLSKVELIRGNICNVDSVEQSIQGCDAVIHLAADKEVVRSVEDPRQNFDVNVLGSFNILQAMRKHDVPYMINASTGGAILGEATPPVHEDMPAKPLSPYGASKLAVEGYCSAFEAAYGLKIANLRFANIYGPYSGLKGSVIPAFICKILAGEDLVIYGDGNQTRDWLYVDDLVEGIVAVLDKEITGVYQLGTGVPKTVNDLIDVLRSTGGDRFASEVLYKPARAGEVVHNYSDISRAGKAFGFSAPTSLEEGVENVWNWFLEQESNKAA